MTSRKERWKDLSAIAIVLSPIIAWPIMLYATNTPIDHKGMRYWVRQSEEATVVDTKGFAFTTMFDRDNDGLVDIVHRGRWGGRLAPFKFSKKYAPTKEDQEIFDNVMEKYYNRE